MYYLDNAATTKPHPEVLKKIPELLNDSYGNPSSVHPPGHKARQSIENSRKTLAKIFQVPLAGVVFCSSGTESDNLAIKGVLQSSRQRPARIVTTALEHSAVTNTCNWLSENEDVAIDIVKIDVDSGLVDLDHLSSIVSPDTILASIQHVNSETGIIQDLSAISKVIKTINKKVVIHSDGVQAFGRIPVNLNQLGIDLYSISSHKFHGIKGSGALIINKKTGLQPLIHGGGQESGIRSGTENVAAIAAMGIAAENAVNALNENSLKLTSFAEFFKYKLKENINGCRILEKKDCIPHIISFSVPGILGEVLLHHLAQNEIYVSTGSACNASSKKLSSVLQAVGYSKERIMETIRISLAASEIPVDQEKFVERFIEIVLDLKKMTS